MLEDREMYENPSNASYNHRWGSLFLFVLLLALLITRNTQDMADRMFWLNEVYDYFVVKQPFWDIPKWTTSGYFLQPPLFYWIGHVVVNIGSDPMTLRSISLAFYIIMIGFVIFGFRELQIASRVFLCFILIMSPFGAYAATEFRPYALAALSILVSSVLFYRAIMQPSRWLPSIFYGLAALMLQNALILNSFVFGLQMLFLSSSVVYHGRNAGYKQTLIVYKSIILVSIPLFIAYGFYLYSATQAGLGFYPSSQFYLLDYLKAVIKNIVIIKEEIVLIRSWALSFAPATFLLGCVIGFRRYRWPTTYLILLFGGQILFSTFIIFSRIDYSAQRHFVASYIAFALLCAVGAEYLFQRLDKKASTVIIVCLLITTLPGGMIKYIRSLKTPGLNPITQAIEALRCPNQTTVVISDPWRNGFVSWYAYRDDPLIITPHRPSDPYINNAAEEISKGAAKNYCFILIEGPQNQIYKGQTYDIFSSLHGYSQKKYSIAPGHAVPDFAWVFTPSSAETNLHKVNN